MLGGLTWTLRQRRYAMLAAVLAVVALGCAGAGTFELHRFHEKRHDNAAIRANAHAAPVPLTRTLVPVVANQAPGAVAIRYRTVVAVGAYLPDQQQYLGNQSQGGRQGFYVLTPMRTSGGVLLLVRGFVAGTAADRPPAAVAPPPSGVVRVRARLQDTRRGNDDYGRLGAGVISSIDPSRQAARIGRPTYQTAATLLAGQPGGAGLSTVPTPGVDNPTGGASEFQLLSYVIQWYVFALLALAAPFLFSRAEVRDARRRFLGVDDDAAQFDLEGRHADALPAGGSGADPDTALVLRERGELARADEHTGPRWQHAARLADRYGRSLGPGTASEPVAPFEPVAPVEPDASFAPQARTASADGLGLTTAAAVRSADTPHRVADDYHAQYSDYLWQLALADGAVPVRRDVPTEPAAPELRPERVIDAEPPPPADR